MTLIAIVMAFLGGIFGAMMGALAAFIMCGVVGLIGIALAVAGAEFDMIGVIAFGPFFGPHISFGAGVAAAAYAAKKGYIENGKDIVTGLMSLEKTDVLLVGGIFGVFAHVCAYGIGLVLPGKIDGVGLTVVVSALVAKMLFTGEFISKVPSGQQRFGCSTNVLDVWVPYMRSISQQTILAITAGGLSAYITMLMLQDPKTAGVAGLLGFCISATSLVFSNLGTAIPVTHHITLCASYGVIASGGNIWWGFAGGILGALVGDTGSRLLHCHGKVHVDPAATGIAGVSLFLLGIFPATGVYSLTWLPMVIVAAAILMSIVEKVRSNAASTQSANA